MTAPLSLTLIILCGLAGVILILIEGLLPGFGLPGISGIACEVACVVLSSMQYGFAGGIISFLALGVLTAIALLIAYRSAKKGRLNRLILHDTERPDSGECDLSALVGKTGSAVSALRPSGTIQVDGVRYEAQSTGDLIEAKSPIRVTAVQGGKIIVNRVVVS